MSQTRGTIESCPCPHCKKPNDFRPLTAGGGWGETAAGIEKGAVFNCDYCGKKFQIVNVRPVTLLWLRPVR